MTIKYWTDFSKRKNSTKQPTGGTQATVRLKEPCGIASPSFICAGIPDTVKYIEAFGRYYFVSEVTHDGAEIVIDCVSDPMATFKSSIGSLYADVEYTSSSTNTDIADPRNKPTNYILESVTGVGTLSGFNASGAQYILGVCSDEGINYYSMASSDVATLCSNLFDKNIFSAIGNQFYDVKNLLVSCIRLPRLAVSGGDSINAAGGSWYLGSGHRIPDSQRLVNLFNATKTLTFPTDAMGLDFSYLDCAPYTTGMLFLPFVGVVPLDVDSIAQNKSIYVRADLDLFTGDIIYRIGRSSGSIISTYTGNCAANVPICGSSYNAIGATQGAVTAIGGAVGLLATVATEGAAGAAALASSGALVGGASQVMTSLQHHTQTNGSISSYIGVSMGVDIKATVLTRRPAESLIDSSYKAVSGMPYFKGATISNLSGFVKCNGASISIPGFESDRETINSYLNSGFYYE